MLTIEEDGFIEVQYGDTEAVNLDLYKFLDEWRDFFQAQQDSEEFGELARSWIVAKGFPDTISTRAAFKLVQGLQDKAEELKKKDSPEEPETSEESPSSTE